MASTKYFSVAMVGSAVMALATSQPASAANLHFISAGKKIGIIEPSTGTVTQIVKSQSFLDIAVSEDGTLFGVTERELYKIDRNSGESLIGKFSSVLNALAFGPGNKLYGAGNAGFYSVDTLTGAASLVAGIPGFYSSGDIVFDPLNKRFLGTSGVWYNNENDSLFSIELNGAATKIGDIGFRGVYGLIFDRGTLLGYTSDRKQIVINQVTGAGTFDKDVTGVGIAQVKGAASIPTIEPDTSVPEPSSVLGSLAFSIFIARNLSKRK